MNKQTIVKNGVLLLALLGFLLGVTLFAGQTRAQEIESQLEELQAQYREDAETKRKYAGSCAREKAMEESMTALNLRANALRKEMLSLKATAPKE